MTERKYTAPAVSLGVHLDGDTAIELGKEWISIGRGGDRTGVTLFLDATAAARLAAVLNEYRARYLRGPVAPLPDEADNMCPNCLTPWKCNGPHDYATTRAGIRAAKAWTEAALHRANAAAESGPPEPTLAEMRRADLADEIEFGII
jgi:hypothetical protein